MRVMDDIEADEERRVLRRGARGDAIGKQTVFETAQKLILSIHQVGFRFDVGIFWVVIRGKQKAAACR